MKEAYNVALRKTQQSNARGAKHYNRRLNFSELQAGDRVLVRNLTPRGGPGKLRSYWEDAVHVVVNRRGDGPVYEVQREDQEGRARVLHRNLLLPCDFIQEANQANQRQQRPRRHPKTKQIPQQRISESDESDSSIRDTGLTPVALQQNHTHIEDVEDNDRLVITVDTTPNADTNIANDGQSECSDEAKSHSSQTEERGLEEQVSRYPRRESRLPVRYGYNNVLSVGVAPDPRKVPWDVPIHYQWRPTPQFLHIPQPLQPQFVHHQQMFLPHPFYRPWFVPQGVQAQTVEQTVEQRALIFSQIVLVLIDLVAF